MGKTRPPAARAAVSEESAAALRLKVRRNDCRLVVRSPLFGISQRRRRDLFVEKPAPGNFFEHRRGDLCRDHCDQLSKQLLAEVAPTELEIFFGFGSINRSP